MNVALTRAKCSLYILGNSSCLMNSPLWGALIQDAKTRNVFIPFEESTWKHGRHSQPTNLVERQSPLTTPLSLEDGLFVERKESIDRRRH